MLHKTIRDLAPLINFTTDSVQAWGEYKGYPFTLGCYGKENMITLLTAVNVPDPNLYRDLEVFFSALKAEKKLSDFKSTNGSFTLSLFSFMGSNKTEDIQALLDRITDKFTELNVSPACFQCNEPSENNFARYNEVAMPLCDQCYSALEDRIQQNLNAHGNKASNYLPGVIGAVLGALVGSTLWVIIGLLGYMASIAGLAIAFVSAKGYTLFKGKVTRLTPWIIGICTLFGLIIAQFVTLDLVFYNELKDSITLGQALSLTFDLPFIDPEITASFIKDTVIGLIFAGLGAFGTIRSLSSIAQAPAGSIERI